MQNEKFLVKLTLEKKEDMIYFSQMDISSILTRALRRAELPVYYTQGFNPRIKMSFGKALKLGVPGKEEVTLYFIKSTTPKELCEKLSPQLPQGLSIVEII